MLTEIRKSNGSRGSLDSVHYISIMHFHNVRKQGGAETYRLPDVTAFLLSCKVPSNQRNDCRHKGA